MKRRPTKAKAKAKGSPKKKPKARTPSRVEEASPEEEAEEGRDEGPEHALKFLSELSAWSSVFVVAYMVSSKPQAVQKQSTRRLAAAGSLGVRSARTAPMNGHRTPPVASRSSLIQRNLCFLGGPGKGLS